MFVSLIFSDTFEYIIIIYLKVIMVSIKKIKTVYTLFFQIILTTFIYNIL